MAAVYAATHRNGRRYALKILHVNTSRDVRRSFLREAKLANIVRHDGALHVIDEDVSDDDCPFLVLPLLEGETLHARWERNGRRLPVDEVIYFSWFVLEVLASAHEKSVVHRDIKPENIFLTVDGNVRVLDFGIARIWAGPDAAVSRTGTMTGTPAFMAPEQVLGHVDDIDGQTDLWAVGATMFTLLSGRYVHVGKTGNEILVSAGSKPACSLAEVAPEVPRELSVIVDRSLAFDPSNRWADAEAMRAALDEYARLHLGVAAPLLRASLLSDPARRPVAQPSASSGPANNPDTEEPQGSSARALLGAHSTTSFHALRAAVTRTLRLERSAALWRPARLAVTRTLEMLRWTFASRFRTGATSVALLLAVSAGVGWLRTWKPKVGGPSAATNGAPNQIAKYLAASRRAWLDGDMPRARGEADKATDADPANARAHLASVVATTFWPDQSARAHFMRAQELRADLSPSEAAYLDAMAPAMTEPADFRLSAQRLEKLLASNQDDLNVRVALADTRTRLGELDAAVSLLSTAVEADSPTGIVLGRYGALETLRDNVDLGRKALERCLTFFPGSAACAAPLARLEMNEGQCADAERILRKEISVSPKADVYLDLAYTIERLGAPAEEVQPVLENWVRFSPEGDRPRNAVRARIRVHLMQGELREALNDYVELEPLIEQTDDDVEQFDYTEYRMLLEAELGKRDASRATLRRYVSKRQSFQRDVDGDDNVTALFALGAEFGFVPWQEWLPRRDDHLRHPQDRDGLLDGRTRNWLDNFAIPAVTAEEAKEALDQLPRYLPILHRSDRWYWHDSALGRVYDLTGHNDDAIPYFERATSSCGALEDLVQFTRGEAEYADFLLRNGNVAKACTLYGKVLVAWPSTSGSSTAQHATVQADKFCKNTTK